jgi:hypothetical protein
MPLEAIDDFRPMLASRIRAAFHGVRLGNGFSIAQTQAIDEHAGENYPTDRSAFDEMRAKDIVDDWEALHLSDLEDLQFCWVDLEGFRYYLPAMMISTLAASESELDLYGFDGWYFSWTATQLFGTIERMDPRFKELSHEQQQACALFVKFLPRLLDPCSDEAKVLERRLSQQWERFIPLTEVE